MEILLVRHAEPEWVVDGRSVADPSLTPLGQAQARAAAIHLAALEGGITELLVSPARRAQETVSEFERAAGMTATIISGLNEIHVPWDDTPGHLVEAMFVAARDRPLQEWWNGLEGGESFRDFHFRITETIDAVLRQRGLTRLADEHLWHDAGLIERLVIVAHAGTNAVVLGHLLGLDPTPWEWERFISHHAAYTRLRTAPLAGEHIMSLWEANATSHLAQEYLTR
jgi:probable phosphoglycerate mutase